MSLWKARNKNGKIQWIKDLITENQGEKAYISPEVFERKITWEYFYRDSNGWSKNKISKPLIFLSGFIYLKF